MRKGMATGQGKGYKNIQGSDPTIHSQSAKGIKQPQQINVIQPIKPTFKLGEVFPYGMSTSKTSVLQEGDDFYFVTDQWTTTRYPKTKEGLNRANAHIKENQKIDKQLKEDRELEKKPNPYFNAGEILNQLGGNKFIAMTGANTFVKDDKNSQIIFRIPKAKDSINYVKIKLNSMDTYDVQFIRTRGDKTTIVNEVKGVYNDQLQDIFTENTGLYTHL